MSNWKVSGKRVKTTSVLLALFMLGAISSQSVRAQEAPNQVTDITISPRGELIINVDGEGFDPMLRLEAAPNGEFRIVVQGQGVTLAPGLNQANSHLGGELNGKIPAIEGAMLSRATAPGQGFQLVLTSWRKLQPQILSNDGHQIVISLVGDRSLPPAVIERRHQAEQQRIALQKKLAELKKQAEVKAQLALQHQAELKRQAEANRQVASKRQAEQQRLAEIKKQADAIQQAAVLRQKAEQQQVAALQKQQETKRQNENRQRTEQQRLAAIQKQKNTQAHPNIQLLSQQALGQQHPNQPPSAQQRLGQPKLQTEIPEIQDEAQYQAELQQEKKALEAQQRQALAHKGAVESSGWQTAYAAPSNAGPITQLQLAHHGGKSASVKHLMQEVSPAPAQSPNPPSPTPSVQTILHPTAQPMAQPQAEPARLNMPAGESTEDTTPTEPLRLTKPPSNYAPEPDWQAPPEAQPAQKTPRHNETRPSPTNPMNPAQSPGADAGRINSIYALVNAPHADVSLRSAWHDLMNGNAIAAQATLHQRLKNAPDDVNARYLLAKILLSPLLENPNASPTEAAQALTVRREEARQELLKNYAQSLHWPSCQALLELFLDEGKLEEASRILAQASRAYPHEAGVAFEQGRLQEALVDLDAARTAYQQALGLQPDNPEIHYRLAQVELKSSHLEAARWELLQALTWSPNDSRLYKLLGYIADKTGQAPQAAKAYRQALPVDALINYARALEAQNQPERALSLYQAVEALAGDNGDILYNLAMIYTNTRRPARATAVLTRFLALGGDQRDARVSKAKSLLQQLSTKK